MSQIKAVRTHKGESRLSVDVDKFNVSLYNEITLSAQERNRVQSAMMTWKYTINAPNYVNLSNGYTYLAKLDEDGEVHIYEKVLSKNIHQKGDAYDRQTRRKFNNVVQIVRNEQGSNNRSINLDKNGRDSETVDTSNNRQVRSKRDRNGRGYLQNDNDVSSTQERKGIVYFDASQEEDRRLSVSVNQTPQATKINTINTPKQKLTNDEKIQAVKDKVGEKWLNLQIQITNIHAGIEHEAKVLGGNLEAEVHRARASSASAINALTNEQRDYSGKNRVGESLADIFEPVFKEGPEYTQDFYNYLYHYHNCSDLYRGVCVDFRDNGVC